MHSFSRRSFLKTSGLAGLLISGADDELFANNIPEKGAVFLFQGDSITDGNRGRNLDPNHIMGHGYAYSVASRIGADFADHDFKFYNRGISGNKITDLQKRWQADTLDLKPNVLSILIGVNDTAATIHKPEEATMIGTFENIYRQLLTDCKNQNPDILFVLGLPFIYPVGKVKDDWDQWKSDLSQRAASVRKLATEFDAVLIDYPAMLNQVITPQNVEYWIWDGIHPTVFAHELMAREWLKQVSERLIFLKKYY